VWWWAQLIGRGRFRLGQHRELYISILLDSRPLAGTAAICIYLYFAIMALSLSLSASHRSNSLIFLFAYFVLLLVESYFNSYLLAMVILAR
jgi:hypothetical protein